MNIGEEEEQPGNTWVPNVFANIFGGCEGQAE
jgi:hypothetical protein